MMHDADTLWFAFGLTLLAGLSTGIGSLLAFLVKPTDSRFLTVALGFSAGVMIYVSLVEIFADAYRSLSATAGNTDGFIVTNAAFFGGILLTALIDFVVPEYANPHEIKQMEEHGESPAETVKKNNLNRMGLFSAVAIAIHNFPEGLATFISSLQKPTLGLTIAVAIAIHNIPEGITVSVPIYHSTGSRKKAFWFSFLSGLSEPLGAVIGYFFLMNFMTPFLFGILFATVAGIMVYISLDELLPMAEKYGEHHIATFGVVIGMAVMAVSLVLFK